jgi:hypothetical protein
MLTLLQIVGCIQLAVIALWIALSFPINRMVARERAAGLRVWRDGIWVRRD